MDADEEASEVNATAIQTMLRMRMASKVKNKLMGKLKLRKETQQKHEEYMQDQETQNRDMHEMDMKSLSKVYGRKGDLSPMGSPAMSGISSNTHSPVYSSQSSRVNL